MTNLISRINCKRRGRPFLVAAILGLPACTDFTVGGAIPSDLANPSAYRTATAARELANHARLQFLVAATKVPALSGLLSDEFTYYSLGSTDGQLISIDRRVIPERSKTIQDGLLPDVYGSLHLARGYAINAIGALRKYDSTMSHQLQAELWAIQGYTMIYLADIFCSGIPLSQIEFEGDFIYVPGSPTHEVYQRAIDAFDSSLALRPLSGDARIDDWARIGKARALLALGQSKQAATVVSDIDLTYEFALTRSVKLSSYNSPLDRAVAGVSVADREGMNGFAFVSGGDPRTAVYKSSRLGGANWPKKNQTVETGTISFIIASGIEAYLIRAEAALDDGEGDVWLQLLNDARASRQLAALTDPGDPDERYRMLADERAAWLFVTGHRQGDLRRMVRNRKILQDEVYPTGPWQGTFDAYGSHTNVPIPDKEFANPFYRGCLDRDA